MKSERRLHDTAIARDRRMLGGRRVSHRTPCRLRSESGEAVGETVNLSDGGLAVIVGSHVEEGVVVEVLLPEFGGAGVQFLGRVTHSRRINTGTFEVGLDVERSASLSR